MYLDRPFAAAFDSKYSLPSWDKRANETKCYCEERPGLQEQIYKHVIIAVQHVVYSTMKHEYPHYELQLVNPVQIQQYEKMQGSACQHINSGVPPVFRIVMIAGIYMANGFGR
ncbi:hypothetical protein ACET3Z_002052 [Daucus carota]